MKKGKKAEAAAPEVKKEKRVVNDTDRHKPFGKTAWAPVDDVYVLKHYPRTIYSADDAVELLKSYQALDFTPHDQPVYVDLKLDMKLEKKVSGAPSLANCSCSPKMHKSPPKLHFHLKFKELLFLPTVFPATKRFQTIMSYPKSSWNCQVSPHVGPLPKYSSPLFNATFPPKVLGTFTT